MNFSIILIPAFLIFSNFGYSQCMPPCSGGTPVCFVGANICVECLSNGDCDDGDPNTIDICDGFSCSSVLPINLMFLRAFIDNDDINIVWATSSEINNLGFDLMRSDDGLTWSKIDFINGHLTTDTTKEYNYRVSNPSLGNNYFRLKQIDLDGSFSYSEIANAFYENSENTFRIFPNPSDQYVTVEIANPNQEEILIKVISNLGIEILESKIYEEDLYVRQEISVENSGIYTLCIFIGNAMYQKRIVIN